MFILFHVAHRYTLTVWTGQNDRLTLQDLLPYKKQIDSSRIYYDLPDLWETENNLNCEMLQSYISSGL